MVSEREEKVDDATIKATNWRHYDNFFSRFVSF
jgi:hypothetical protein